MTDDLQQDRFEPLQTVLARFYNEKKKRKVFQMKLGFIGTGNMASAIMGGIIKNQIIPAEEIIGADLFAPGRERAKAQFGIHVTDSNKEVVEKADVIVLSVKPQFYADVIQEIKDLIRADQIVITIAPGKTLAWLAEQFGKDVKLVRTMPNTPAMVGAGMTAACPNEHMTEEETAYVRTLLESFSRVEIVPERLMDTVVSVSGSSPAYVFMLIEAMADAAVSGGMPRPQAYQFAAQAVLGFRDRKASGRAEGYGMFSGRNDDRGCACIRRTRFQECGI